MARAIVHGGLHTDDGLVAHASQAGLRQHRSSQADFDEMDVLDAAANEAEDALVYLQVRAKFLCSRACPMVGSPLLRRMPHNRCAQVEHQQMQEQEQSVARKIASLRSAEASLAQEVQVSPGWSFGWV